MLGLLVLILAAVPPPERALALAKAAPPANAAYAELLKQARTIRNPSLQATVRSILVRPEASFATALDDSARAKVRAELVKQNWLDPRIDVATLFAPFEDPQPSFLAAPARSEHGHHSHPGGLVEHTAVNLASALALANNYAQRAGLTGPEALDHDALVAAPLLHDAMKPFTLRWREDGTPTEELTLAGTSSHHVFGIAEAFHRQLPAALIVAIASAHEAPFGTDAAKVVSWIRAGAILARVDPVAAGVLEHDGSEWTLASAVPIEAAVNHLADHDYVLQEPAAELTDAALERLLRESAPQFSQAQRRWARNRIEAQIPTLRLYAAWQRGGDHAVAELLKRLHVPLTAPADRS